MSSPALLRSPRTWEWEALALSLFVGAAFFFRLGDIPLVGEETRRALIAREMVQSGDWIVPYQQGLPRLTKPPLQYWAIAVSTFLFGGETLFAIRFPSAVSILLTALVIYGYARNFLSRAGALAAGLSFLTMGEILHSGRFAQIDPMFTLFLSAALLTWHWGYMRGWPACCTWGVSYALAALAALTKGPQAPVYFAAGVGIYLLICRDWRFLFSWAHALGLTIFGVLVGAWLVPFWSAVGTEGVVYLWAAESLGRSNVFQQTFLAHFVRFPGEILLCSLPWSPLLLAYLRRDFRAKLGEACGPALFLFGCVGFALPTCWIPPGGEARYLMPLYPCVGVLAAVVLERIGLGQATEWMRGRSWSLIRPLGAGLMLLCAAGALLWIFGRLPAKIGTLHSSVAEALVYTTLVLGLLAVYWRFSRSARPSAFITHAAFACFLGASYNWAAIARLEFLCRDMEQTVAQGRQAIPPGTPLVSLNWVHHRFVYYYPEPVRVMHWQANGTPPPADVCFCVDCRGGETPQLPFSWKVLAAVPVDRYYRSGAPQAVVIIGQRLPDSETATASRAP